jgi:hypothetical protein
VTYKQEGNQESGHLVLGDHLPVLVLDVHEQSQNVGPVALVGVLPPLPDDLGEELGHLLAGRVALPVGLGGGVGPEDRDGGEAVIQVVVQRLQLLEDVPPGVLPVQAPGRGEDGELGQRRQQVDGAPLAPVLLEVLAGLLLDLGHVLLQARGPQPVGHGLHLDHPVLLGGVVHDVLAKDGAGEVVHFVLRQDVVARLEEDLLRLGPDQEGQALEEDLQGTVSSMR